MSAKKISRQRKIYYPENKTSGAGCWWGEDLGSIKTQSEENKTSGAKHCCLDWIFWCELDKIGPQFSHPFLSDLINTVFTPTSPPQPCQCILILNPSNNESWPSGTLLAPLSDTSGSPKQCKSLLRSHLLWMIFLLIHWKLCWCYLGTGRWNLLTCGCHLM